MNENERGNQCWQNGPDHISAKDWQLGLAREGFGTRWDV